MKLLGYIFAAFITCELIIVGIFKFFPEIAKQEFMFWLILFLVFVFGILFMVPFIIDVYKFFEKVENKL